jgi:hypothetical protein
MFDARYFDHSEAKEPAMLASPTSRDPLPDAQRANSCSYHHGSRGGAKSIGCGVVNGKIHGRAVDTPSLQDGSRGALFDLWQQHVTSEEPDGGATTSGFSFSLPNSQLFDTPPKPDISAHLPQKSFRGAFVSKDGPAREDRDPPIALLLHDGGQFGGVDQPLIIPHDPLHSTREGTWSLRFMAYNPGNAQNQTLLSKEPRGCRVGGHLSVSICEDGELAIGFLGKDDDTYLCYSGIEVEPNRSYHLAFAFSETEINLFLNGKRIDCEMTLPGMCAVDSGDLVLGASEGSSSLLQCHFNGEISNVLLLNRPVSETEALWLFEADGKIDGIDMLYEIGLEDLECEEAAETGRPSTRIKLNKPLRFPGKKHGKKSRCLWPPLKSRRGSGPLRLPSAEATRWRQELCGKLGDGV